MKKKLIQLKESKSDFVFGNCAAIAIGSAFDIPYSAISLICKLVGNDCNNGLTYHECDKLIKKIGEESNKKIEYITNRYSRITYGQLCLLFPKGKYIVMFPTHLSYLENGEIFDSFLVNSNTKVQSMFHNGYPTGWWKII